jgi:hypothetical protein
MDGHIVEVVLTLPRVIVHSQDVQQSRFAGARRPHDRNEFAGLDVEVDPPQDIVFRQALRKIFLDVAKTNHWTS